MASAEMPAEHAILGLLTLEGDREGEGYGYDLARHFTGDQPLATVLRLEPGMLYHHLKKLARARWVDVTVEPQGTRPPRQVYRLTPAGRDELHRWLSEPVARTREIRLEFLVKLYFARRLDPALATRLLTEQTEICRRLATSLSRQRANLDIELAAAEGNQAEATRSFRQLVLDLRLAQTRAALDWLSHAATGTPSG
jgi:PadR family transcriptional regulator AphA